MAIYFTEHIHFVTSGFGKKLLMYKDYTFTQHLKYPRNFYCTKKDSGCRAKVGYGPDGKVRRLNDAHNHEPPKYVITPSGLYYKV